MCLVQYICVVAFGPTTTPVVKQYTSDPPCLGLQSTINLQICSKTFVIPPPKKDLGIANKFTVNPTTSREESILFDHIMNFFFFFSSKTRWGQLFAPFYYIFLLSSFDKITALILLLILHLMSLENTWQEIRDNSSIKNLSWLFRFPDPCWHFFSSVELSHFLVMQVSCQVFSKIIGLYRRRAQSCYLGKRRLQKVLNKRVQIIVPNVFWRKTFIS